MRIEVSQRELFDRFECRELRKIGIVKPKDGETSNSGHVKVANIKPPDAQRRIQHVKEFLDVSFVYADCREEVIPTGGKPFVADQCAGSQSFFICVKMIDHCVCDL